MGKEIWPPIANSLHDSMLTKLELNAQLFAWEASGIVTAKKKCEESKRITYEGSCRKSTAPVLPFLFSEPELTIKLRGSTLLVY